MALLPDRLYVLTEREQLVAQIEAIAPEVVLIDLGNPIRDLLEDFFAVSRALARPIAMFVEIRRGSDRRRDRRGRLGLCRRWPTKQRIKPVLDLAVRRFHAFARLQDELDEARQARRRATIDHAKRILMKSTG